MPDAVIDACCLIDLLASGETEAILLASGFTWHLPAAVEAEVRYCRQRDPAPHGKITPDLSPMVASGLLKACSPRTQQELDQFIRYAAIFRSDGEAMCLALAGERSWTVATDDRKAIRVTQQAGLTVVSCPALLKKWADTAKPDRGSLTSVLQEIEVLAQFKPNPTMPECHWWNNAVGRTIL